MPAVDVSSGKPIKEMGRRSHGACAVDRRTGYVYLWVKIDYPENNGLGGLGNFAQGLAKGGAIFRRPEGTSYLDGTIFFVSTDGGSSGNGQVFSLDIKRSKSTLIYDSPNFDDLDTPDNMTVTPPADGGMGRTLGRVAPRSPATSARKSGRVQRSAATASGFRADRQALR